jgi:multidrug transporter EmrE-like cation transporter
MWLIVASVLCQLGAVLLLKFNAVVTPVGSLAELLFSPLLLSAFACLAMQALVWQRVLATYPLSQAYPITSLIYPGSLLAGWALFDEALTLPGLTGSIMILAGIWMMTRPQAR